MIDGFVIDVASFVSPAAPAEGDGAGGHLRSGGVLVRESRRVTVADAHLGHAQHRGPGGNGYLFEVRASTEVLVRDSTATAGRHGFIQNWGFGTSGCVSLRVRSTGAAALARRGGLALPAASEYHLSLAFANLVDDSERDDGWLAVNRGAESSGAGHTASESVFWNARGRGYLRSCQYGWGYVVGTGSDLVVQTETGSPMARGTEPADFVEGLGRAAGLVPRSLYENQRARRLGATRASPP